MPVTYVIGFRIAPGQRERFRALLDGVLDAMRAEPMFHQAVLHEDPENADQLMLYETWEDHDDVVAVQIRRPYRQAFHAALPEVLLEPRAVSVWRPLRADGRAR